MAQKPKYIHKINETMMDKIFKILKWNKADTWYHILCGEIYVKLSLQLRGSVL